MGRWQRFVWVSTWILAIAAQGTAAPELGPRTPPDLHLTIWPDATELTIGDTYRATVRVINQGSATAAAPIEIVMWGSFKSLSGLTVTPSDSGSCAPVDSDWVCTFPNPLLTGYNNEVVIDGVTNALADVVVYALATAANGDLNPADNYASATTPVTPGVGMEFLVTSTVDDVDALPGDGLCASPGGLCTLRAAIMESNALAGPNIVTIMVAGTLTVDQVVGITADLTLRTGLADNAVISGGDLHQIFVVGGGAFPNLAFQGLDLVHGNGSFAGAVNLDEVGAVSFVDCRLSYNAASGGGAITVRTWSGNLFFDLCAFADNSSTVSGAALAIQGNPRDQRGTLDIRRTIFNSNFSGASSEGGGAIAVLTTDWDLTISDSSFIINGDPVEGGGAIALSGSSLDPITARIERTCFLDNSGASGGGGAILASWVELELVNCTLASNTAGTGGAISVNGGSLALSQTTLTANTASSSGGGVNAGGGAVTLAAATILSGNTPTNCSGAASLAGDANLSSDASCTFVGSGNLSSTPAQLGPANSAPGGLVYYPPLPGSPAVDSAGAAPCLDAFDQVVDDDMIGGERPLDGDGNGSVACDRGAIEVADGALIFADGFESGNMSAWSSLVS
ncbi:MAG: hypothetical protein MUC56_01550 [Thermoanaerobaculales bacterium]|nr:hypothetical protein [Thermoanaerobaculales bacterium]